MDHMIRLLVGISVFWLALGMLFDAVTAVMLPTQILFVAGSKATILGLLIFVGLIIGMLVQPVSGLLSDRVRPRWGRRGALTVGVLLTLGSLANYWFAASILTIALGYLMIEVAASAAQAVQQGFIPDLVPTSRRGTAAGLKGFMDIGGASLGFLILGLLLKSGSAKPGILALATVVVVTFLIAMALVHEPHHATTSTATKTALLDAFRIDLKKHRAFVCVVVSRFLFLLGTYAVGHFFLFFVADKFKLAPGSAAVLAGSVLAALGLCTALASPPTGWAADRFGRIPMMLTGSGLSALGAILLAVSQNTTQLILFGALMGIGSAGFAGANWALTADLVPPNESARFFALANFAKAGPAAIAGLLGPVIDLINGTAPGAGYQFLFAFASLAFILSGLTLRAIKQETH